MCAESHQYRPLLEKEGGHHWQNSTNPGKLLRKRFGGLLGRKLQDSLSQPQGQ
jgi:hypothetical protein